MEHAHTHTPRRLGYIRVSKKTEQNLDLQIDAMRAAGCKRVFEDRKSGLRWKRDGFNSVLRNLRPGDELVVWKLDRLGRSNLILVQERLKQRGVKLVSLTQTIDTSNASGRFASGVLALAAQYEVETNSERTIAGMAAAKARGRHVGRLSNAAIRSAHERAERGEAFSSLAGEFGVTEETLTNGFSRLRLKTSAQSHVVDRVTSDVDSSVYGLIR